MPTTRPRRRPSLHLGDTVRFKNVTGSAVHEGRLVVQPWGRRRHAVVRDPYGRVHYVPSRDNIVEVVR